MQPKFSPSGRAALTPHLLNSNTAAAVCFWGRCGQASKARLGRKRTVQLMNGRVTGTRGSCRKYRRLPDKCCPASVRLLWVDTADCPTIGSGGLRTIKLPRSIGDAASRQPPAIRPWAILRTAWRWAVPRRHGSPRLSGSVVGLQLPDCCYLGDPWFLAVPFGYSIGGDVQPYTSV